MEVFCHDSGISCFPLFRRHFLYNGIFRNCVPNAVNEVSYLARHFAEFLDRKFAADHTFAQAWVVFVLQVDKQRTNPGLVGRESSIKLFHDSTFDGSCAREEQVGRCTRR